MISRRRFLMGATVVALGATAGVVAGATVGEDTADAAQVERFRYKNRDVEITPQGDAAHIMIDNKKMVHAMRVAPGQYSTHLLPFNDYRTLRKLSEDLIDGEESGLFVL